MAALTTFPLEAAVAAVRLMMETEDRFRPAPGYADRLQAGTPITTWMRRDLIDWLVEVAVYFRLHAETVGLAVNYLDRYCSVKPVAVVHYQLVGVTSLLVASKMRDRNPPRILALADLCSGAYERIDIKLMERLICHHLDWHMDSVTSHLVVYHLLPLCTLTPAARDRARTYTELLLEVALPDPSLLHVRASLVATSAVVCALAALRLLTAHSIHRVFVVTGLSTAQVIDQCDAMLALFATVFPGESYLTGPMRAYRAPLDELAALLDAALEAQAQAAETAEHDVHDVHDVHDLQRVPEWVHTT